jgi:HPt (histidine-containing phosphotransfer) domain-containing protein
VVREAAGGDHSLIFNLIDAFSTDTADRIEQIREALAASNFARISDEAHTIKGSARQMGADAVASACQELELACGLQDASLIAARLNVVQERFCEIRGAMAEYSNPR